MTRTVLEVELSQFAAGLSWDDLPPGVQQRVVDIWVDAVANALVGRCAGNTALVEGLATRLCGEGGATVVGGGTTSMTAAAMINGYQVTAYTVCDVYRPALCHITPEVLPALLAAGEQRGCSGRELLAALTVGLEITARLGRGIDYPRFRARGWHAPGVIGTIGAAAATARLLGLDSGRINRAMGLGGSQASGTFAALGTPAVKFHQARGAVSGLWAALFTADGLGGAERILTDDDGGLLATYSDGGTPEQAVDALGERWELEEISLRRWPAASSLQAVVDGLLALCHESPTRPDQVEVIEITLPADSYAMCAGMGWSDELSAMQSARFVSAVVLHDRQCWIEQFGRSRRSDPAVDGFASERVVVQCDPGLPASGASVRVRRRNQPDLLARRDVARGEPGYPLTRADIRDKLAAACSATPTTADPGRLERLLFETADLASIPDLCAALRASAEPVEHEEACP